MSYFIHQLAGVTGGQMLSNVVTTPEGITVVIDGGYDSDAPCLVDYIKRITGGNKVDLWILTHPHLDHINAFCAYFENTPDALDIRRVAYNFPPADFVKAHEYDESEHKTIERFTRLESAFADRAMILHDGDHVEIGDLSFDVLHEPDLSVTANVVNNLSLLIKLYLGAKTCLVTGDLGVEGGNAALSKHGEKLKSDIVEMAHHGQNGVSRDFYRAVEPSVCLWPTPKWLWDNDAGNGYDSHIWRTIVVRGWMSELGVRKHYVAKDGDSIIEIS